MTGPYFAANRPLSRRTFLRGAGVALSLPLLDAMVPAFARGADGGAAAPPRRLLAIQTSMGILPQFFFPEGTGGPVRSSPYLDVLTAHRADLTVFRGVSHPDVDGGHAGERSFLTAAPHPASGAFKNSISLDQLAAERLGSATRFPSLVTQVGIENRSMSFTRGGVMIPPERSPSALYRRMFVQGTAREVAARMEDLRVGRSTLDFVRDRARALERGLGPRDRDRLDQYFTSVRDLESQLSKAQDWETRPKPKVPAAEPKDAERGQFITATKLMYDVVRLALETDSTRLVTVFAHPLGVATDIPGVTHETHTLTHHGNRPETLAELRTIEEAQFQALAGLLGGLRAAKEGGGSLLDRTMVLYGTPMGSANAHSNVNLPVLLAGGGFRHAGLLEFDTKKNYPLPNLFVSMLQRLGLEVDRFASSTGTMRGLEPA